MNKKIKKYMLDNYKDHLDIRGCLCMTTLAEDCSIALINQAADETYFEMAYEIGMELKLLD